MKTNYLYRVLACMGALVLAGGTILANGGGMHERLYAVTTENDLISFYADAPSLILNAHAITGLQGSEEIRGIAFWNGVVYGLGSGSRLYTIDTNTGAATQVGSGQFTPVLNGQSFGWDADPTGLRAVSDLRQNLLISPATGVAMTSGPDLAYAPGDPFFGSAPAITALAFDGVSAKSFGGQWYAADSLRNTLAVLNPITGELNTIGATGIDFSRENGLAISQSSGIMFLASPAASSDPAANLYTVNKLTGAVTLIGLIGNPGDNILLRGLATTTSVSN